MLLVDNVISNKNPASSSPPAPRHEDPHSQQIHGRREEEKKKKVKSKPISPSPTLKPVLVRRSGEDTEYDGLHQSPISYVELSPSRS